MKMRTETNSSKYYVQTRLLSPYLKLRILSVWIIIGLVSTCTGRHPLDLDFDKRQQLYEEAVQRFAVNNSVELKYSEEAGFYIVAKDKDIKSFDNVFRVPYESVLTPVEPFPYK